MRPLHNQRPGTTLVELLIFLAILVMVIGMILPILFSTTENRMLQQTIATVEQNGAQVMQTIELRVRDSERILDPAIGATGSVLTLQTGSGTTNPTIIGIYSGSLIVIRQSSKQTISSLQVAIQNFVVRNTSISVARQSVSISFRVSRTIRLQQPHSYARQFEGGFNLLPDDVTSGNRCGCGAPKCQAAVTYQWEVCSGTSCLLASTPLQCP